MLFHVSHRVGNADVSDLWKVKVVAKNYVCVTNDLEGLAAVDN